MLIPRRTFLAKAWTISWVSALSVLLPSSPVKAQTSTKLKHLEDALLLLEGLRSENNYYQYKPILVTWKGVNGASDYVSRADCSGFMSRLLRHSYSNYFTQERFEQWMKKRRTRPLAEDFYNAIITQKDFTQIKKLSQVQPGDIIAIKYRKEQDIDDNQENGKPPTGHVMLVAETPKERKRSEPLVEGTKQWEVTVIDQSRSGHGGNDTRRIKDSRIKDDYCREDDSFYCGLGKGTMRIYTNEKEEIVGYTWSTFKESEYYSLDERNLVLGRLDFKF